jgi:hypothetical protein
MIEAETLMTRSTDDDVLVFGVWIPRQGDNGRFSVEVVANYGAILTVEVFHKNLEAVGDGTAYSPSTTMTFDATGRQTGEWLGLKELLRFKVSLARSPDLPDSKRGWVMFRFLQPVWFGTVKA